MSFIQKELFTSILPELHKINNIHVQEQKLYSDYLRLAGTVDCIGEYEGKLSVIDFKTSGKLKKKEWISSYFMQCAAYAIMYEERTGIPINKLVVLIAVEGEDSQVFVEKRDNWTEELLKCRDFYENSQAL
jgi:genome maintenance exonuclease 1